MNEEKKLKRAKKKDKKNKKTADSKNKSAGKKQNMFIKPLPIFSELPSETIPIEGHAIEQPGKKLEDNDNSEDDDADNPTDQSEIQMLDSLTGIPCAEDELLFAVPVVAPYSALTNYK